MISVIVPVYNVEKYISQCLESIINQSYQDLEIIVVDDGSTDNSGTICDEFAEKDKRIIVYHTENHGLSAARNYGIDHLQGEWLMFVDSDDWVSPKFCERAYEVARKNNADLVIFQKENTKENGIIQRKKRYKITDSANLITCEEAIDGGSVYAWNKMYKRELFSDIRYPEDHVFEDIAVTHKLIYKAKRIVSISDILIFHRIRKNSISQTKDKQSMQDWLSYHIQRYQELIIYGYPENKAKQQLQGVAINYCVFMPRSNDELYCYAERLLSEVKKAPKEWHWKNRMAFTLRKMDKHLFDFSFGIYRKKYK